MKTEALVRGRAGSQTRNSTPRWQAGLRYETAKGRRPARAESLVNAKLLRQPSGREDRDLQPKPGLHIMMTPEIRGFSQSESRV